MKEGGLCHASVARAGEEITRDAAPHLALWFTRRRLISEGVLNLGGEWAIGEVVVGAHVLGGRQRLQALSVDGRAGDQDGFWDCRLARSSVRGGWILRGF